MPKDWTGSTLGERVLYAIGRAGLSKNHAEFARRAGINKVNLHRYTKSDQLTAERRAATGLTAIAEAAGVSDRWLAMGQGQPEDVTSAATPREERYPTKVPAAEAMRGLVDEEAIRAMLSEEHRGSSEDPGEQFWMERARWWHMERARLRHLIEMDGGALEQPPPLAPRPKAERGEEEAMKTIMIAMVMLGAVAGCSDDPHITPDPSGTGASSQGGNGGTGGSGAAGGAGGASTQAGSFVSGSRLKAQALVGDDGSRSPSGWFDSQLSTECSYTRATDGVTRCLPVGPYTPYFLDSACTLPLVVTNCGKPNYVRVQTDSCGSTSVHAVGGEVNASAPVYTFLTPTTCGEVVLQQGPTRYGAGSAMDVTGFVRATVEVDE